MKQNLLVICIVFSVLQGFSQAKKTEAFPQVSQYWLVILKTGPNDKEIKDSAERARLFEGHFANMKKLHGEGILKAAGPFGENDLTWRGLFVLDCKTKDDALRYVNTDPSVMAGIFVAEMIPWYSEPKGSFVHGVPKE